MTADQVDVLLKTLGLAGAAVAFGAGLMQYVRAQQWKRAEWVANEMRQFYADPAVRRALLMIDWGAREILFPADDPGKPDEPVWVTDSTVKAALMHHSERPAGYSVDEAKIRDTFDGLLDFLERFASFRAAGLVTSKDLRPYLAYWIHHIRAAQGEIDGAERLVQLRAYVESYGFRGVQKLFEDYRTDPLLDEPLPDWWRYHKAGRGG